tara:strand:- start:7588 stop:9582 length:1995 start_codon:yes stop_codon:yes gene_type:complete
MVSNEIWMDSGAMVSMIPEQEIYLGPLAGGTIAATGTASGGKGRRKITLDATFRGNFSLVENLYVGCTLEFYKVSDNAYTDRGIVLANDATTISVSDTIAKVITDTPTDYYLVLSQFGSPVPATKGGSPSNTFTNQVLSVQFTSDTSSQYDDDHITFHRVPTTDGTTSTAYTIGLNQASSYGGSTATTEVDISDADLDSAEDIIDTVVAHIAALGTLDFTVARSGDTLVITNIRGGACTAPATNDSTRLVITTTTAGATLTANNPRLLSDTWIGLVESVTVPTTSVEMRQLNLAASGSRNYVYQFKGTESTDGGSFSLMCNNFSWLYYVLGNKSFTHDNAAALTTSADPANAFNLSDTYSDATFIYDDTNKNRIYRIEGFDVCPPIRIGVDGLGNDFKQISGTATHLIDYTYTEENGQSLPSFALEYTLKKSNSLSTVATDANSENVYTKIYPGCQVDSLTIEASEGQEIKSTVSIKSKTTVVAPTNYDTFNGQTDVKNFINYGSRKGSDTNLNAGLMTPYFFSGGTIEMFGQDYLKIQTCTLTISNQLQDKRYVGRYDKRSKTHVTGQRTYELSLSGYVTDDQIFEQLRNESAFALTGGTSSDIKLSFFKENGEQMVISFKDYMVKSGDFPLTNDKGPITVSWVIQPLHLQSATESTYWVTQG